MTLDGVGELAPSRVAALLKMTLRQRKSAVADQIEGWLPILVEIVKAVAGSRA